MFNSTKTRLLLFATIAIVGCALDLWTKHILFSWLKWGEVFWVWEGHFGWQLGLNEGALFGLGQGMVWLFAVFAFLAALFIPVWIVRLGDACDRWLTVALGCVMAGVLGNLYDRLGLPGLLWEWPAERVGQPVYAVRDWILFQWDDQWRWPNFNIADMFLVCGAVMLFWASLKWKPQSTESQDANSAT